jgi:hypothetical protein
LSDGTATGYGDWVAVVDVTVVVVMVMVAEVLVAAALQMDVVGARVTL